MRATRRDFLKSASSAPFVPRPAAAASNGQSACLSKVRIGAEFFLNRTETRDSVFEHFRRMGGTGLSLARIFTLWDQVEPEQGQWDFTRYDWIYDAAARNGILIANTLCSEDPPGWMESAPFYHAWRDLSNPALRPHSEIYLDKVINHYKKHTAHSVWLLQNEPGIQDSVGHYLLAEYARWLEKKYGSVANLNKTWYRHLKRFEDVRPPEEPRTAGWADYAANLDWRRFRCDHLVAQLEWLRSQVDRHDRGALTHANPPGLTSNMPASGRDLYQIKHTVDFLGSSIHAAWNFGMFPREDFGVAYGYCCDLVRTASPPAPWWVTELQAGPTVFTGARPMNPSAGEIARWLWDGIGNGARGIVFWLWHPRTEGNEAGEWALAGPNGETTERTLATQTIAQVLEQHQDFFSAAKPVPASTAILYDRNAMLLYAVDGWRRPNDEIMHSLMGCYKACHRAHVPVDFIDDGELERGGARNYRVLYLPYCYVLSAKCCAAIREFVREGGVAWADGLVAWKDEQGTTKQMPPGPLSDVFGFTLDDIESRWDAFAFTTPDQDSGQLWRCVIPAAARDVIATAPDGRPAAVSHSFGKGRAIYYGTALSLSCLRRENANVQDWIAAPALETARDLPVRMTEGPRQVAFRAMQSANRHAAVLNNWGATAPVTVLFPPSTQSLVDIVSGGDVAVTRVPGGVKARFELGGGRSAVLLSTRA